MIKIKNLADKGEIYIYGVIIDDTDASWLIRDEAGTIGFSYPDEIRKQLDELKGKPIDVHIASDGGDVAAGIAIFNMLSKHDAPVTVYIDSWAASIASFIAFAGNKIVMPENTFLMIHHVKAGAFGESGYLRAIADWLDKLETMIAETYAKHVIDGSSFKDENGNRDDSANKNQILKLMDAETWFTAKDAADLFDNVELVESNSIEAVAQYKSEFKNAPKVLQPENATDVKVKNILKILQEAYSYEEKSGIVKSN